MTSIRSSDNDIAQRLLGLSAWIRGQTWLQPIYRRFPQSLRNRVSFLLASRASKRSRFQRTANWMRPVSSPSTQVVSGLEVEGVGVNLFGYLRGQFGLAESARMYARSLIGAGYPTALYDVSIDLPHGMDDRSLDDRLGQDAPYPVSIIFVNPDYLESALKHIGEARLRGRYLIACWFWELQDIPNEWLRAIDLVDEIMVASTFVKDAFQRVTDKPVFCVPQPVTPTSDSGLQREDFGLERDAFIFLCTFDFNSWVHRKNPFAVIEAFRRAFPAERSDVRLLVKSSNGHRHPDKLLKLLNASAQDPRIVVRDEVIDRAHVHALQRCTNVYVSLHRAEGFGLGLAECMLMGKPVIATRWSGNLDFMDDSNSCLVDCTLIPVGEGEYPHPDGANWADADVDHASRHMRRLADDPTFAEGLGMRAAADVARKLSPKAAAECLIRRIESIAQECISDPSIKSSIDFRRGLAEEGTRADPQRHTR